MLLRWIAALLLPVLLGGSLPASSLAESFPNARWKAEEQRCISRCPKLPRFSGVETDAQYEQRIRAEDAYNRCYGQCVKQYQERVRLPYKPFDDGSGGYHRRNGGQ
ncbi:MAG: hypothetical protein V3573_12170 [Desulfovibrionaceae bacterium]